MEFKATKLDEANAVVTANITNDVIEQSLDVLIKQASKTMDIQGFRKGKVPVAIIKQRYGKKMREDAQSEALKDLYQDAIKELKIDTKEVIGEPSVTKFDIKDDKSIDVQINICSRSQIDLGDYKKLLPKIKAKKVTAKEINDKINEIAKQKGTLEKLKRKRTVKSGDFAIIDFEGFKDGVAFDGGKGENYTLEIGSNSFIPGFEEQLISMKYDEQKEINLTFPKEYQVENLAGADVVFKVKLNEIQTKVTPKIDDEFAKIILQGDKDATVEKLKDEIKKQIANEKKATYYDKDLKPKYLNSLVETLDFALPKTIIDQEINQIINEEVRDMSEDELQKLKVDEKKIEKMRKKAEPQAIKSVKATFIIDALAKAEKIEVTDQEVGQTIYYEAMMTGQDGKTMLEHYEKQGYLPAIKMSILEQKVMAKLLDEKAGEK
jgi:trigger factor